MLRTEKYLFKTAAADWLEHIRPGIKYSSLVRYTNIINAHLLPEFAEISIYEITRERVNCYHTHLLEGDQEHPGLAAGTIATIFSVLRRILQFSNEKREVSISNLQPVIVRQQKKPLRVFSLSEQKQLNQYLCSHISLPNIGILLTLYTGLRIGELCALKWQDIILDEQILYVHHTMQRVQTFQEKPRTQVIITDPKSTSSIRYIPIPDFLIEMIQTICQDEACFLLTGDAKKYMEPRTVENHFGRILRACSIEHATFHTLRHTCATRCIEQGVDVKTLSEILGHASVNITMNRYVHPSMEFKRENMNKLAGLFEG